MGLYFLIPACLVLFGVSAMQLLRPGGSGCLYPWSTVLLGDTVSLGGEEAWIKCN